MKKYPNPIMGLFAVMALAASVQAQNRLELLQDTTPEFRAEVQTKFMKRKLHLTEKQVRKVSALNLSYAEKIDPILKGPEGEFIKAAEIRRLEVEKEGALQEILSDEQFRTYLASRKELREKLLERAR